MDDFVKKVDVKKTQGVAANIKNRSKAMMVIAGIVVVGSLVTAGVFYKQAQDAKGETLGAQQERNQEESERVIGKLKTVLLIDQQDKPTVARVDNADELRKANEDFYKNAETIAKRIVNLPCHLGLTISDLDHIKTVLRDFVRDHPENISYRKN